MKILLVSLLCISCVVSDPACFMGNTDIAPGKDLTGAAAANYFECQRLCQDNDNCVMWVYLTASFPGDAKRWCGLKSAENIRGESPYSKIGVVTGPKFCADRPCYMENADIGMSKHLRLNTKGAGHYTVCQRWCQDNPACVMWVYTPTDCYQKSAGNIQGETTYSYTGAITGPRICPNPACYMENKDIAPGVELSSSAAADYIICQHLCQNNDNCVMWVYLTASFSAAPHYCVLKSAENIRGKSPYSLTGVMTGPKFCRDPACYEEDTDIAVGKEVAHSHSASFAECQGRCQGNHACAYWAYLTASFPGTQHWCVQKSLENIRGETPYLLPGVITGPKFCKA